MSTPPRHDLPASAPAATSSVDDRGLRLAPEVVEVQDVLFDGARVWSFHPLRDGSPEAGGRRVRWPEALRPFLDGEVRTTVRGHLDLAAAFDAEVRFGARADRVRVVDGDGHPLAVDKAGRLHRMFAERDEPRIERLVDAVGEVLDALGALGVQPFLAFGCLLGAVRDGRMIGHDSDADVSYLSEHTHPGDVARESFRLERQLRAKGWSTARMSGADFKVLVQMPDGAVVGIDVFTSFYAGGVLHVMPTVRSRLSRTALLPQSTVVLEGRSLLAPADPPALLAATYGDRWRVPDPSFRYDTPRATRRRLGGWMRGDRRHLAYWNTFYSSAASAKVPTEPSPFARWVREREEPATLLVDVGTGNGRDALWFAREGFQTLGLDYAPAALRGASALARRERLPATFATLNLYDLRDLLARGAILARADRPRVLYARFLVHALEDEGRHNLWLLTRMALRAGGRLYVEFRVTETRHAFGEHFRRFVDPAQVVAEVEQHGGRVEWRHEGRGLAPYQDEDPQVCRLVARWDR